MGKRIKRTYCPSDISLARENSKIKKAVISFHN